MRGPHKNCIFFNKFNGKPWCTLYLGIRNKIKIKLTEQTLKTCLLIPLFFNVC